MRASLIFLLLFVNLLISAQQIITSAGDFSNTNNSSLQWTVGQIVTGVTTDGDNYLIQGFQSSTITVTTIFDNEISKYSFKVYPNPVKSALNIEIENKEPFELIAKLYDVTGAEISNYVINGSKHKIDLSNIRVGTYILKISEHNRALSSYKIIKQ